MRNYFSLVEGSFVFGEIIKARFTLCSDVGKVFRSVTYGTALTEVVAEAEVASQDTVN